MDKVRQLGSNKPITHAVTTSSGAHVTLPEWYGSHVTGMIVPKTKVGFMLSPAKSSAHRQRVSMQWG